MIFKDRINQYTPCSLGSVQGNPPRDCPRAISRSSGCKISAFGKSLSLGGVFSNTSLLSTVYGPNLSGLPRNLWKVPQTFGRAGRDKKLQAVGIQMYWPGQKGLWISNFNDTSKCLRVGNYIQFFAGKTTPAGKVREIFTGQGCRRAAINAAFTLSNVHSKGSSINYVIADREGGRTK